MRLQLDPGTEWLLGFAKKKLIDLKANAQRLGVRQLQKILNVDSGEQIRVFTGYGGDAIYITGLASIANRLYDWPTGTSLVNFGLHTFPPPQPGVSLTVVPPEKRITAVPAGVMQPLGDYLEFTPSGTLSGLEYRSTASVAKLFNHFELLTKTKKWMLRQWMERAFAGIYVDRMPGDAGELANPPPIPPTGLTATDFANMAPAQFLAYQNQLAYWRPLLAVDFNDCFMSEPVVVPAVPAQGSIPAIPEHTECYFLLGRFPPPLTAPFGAAANKSSFRGVVVSLSTIKAINPSTTNGILVDFSSYNPTITIALRSTIRVLKPQEYERYATLVSNVVVPRPDLPTPFPVGGVGGGWDNTYAPPPYMSTTLLPHVASPFNVTFEIYEQWMYKERDTQAFEVGGGSGPRSFHTESETKFSIKQHRLTSTGQIDIVDYDYLPFTGPFSYSSSYSSPASTFLYSPVTTTMNFWTGEKLFAVGDYAFGGAGFPGAIQPITMHGMIPFTAGSPPSMFVDEYLPEYKLLRSGDVVFAENAPRDFTSSYTPSSLNNFTHLTGPFTLQSVVDSPSITVRTEATSGVTFGLTNQAFLSTQGSMQPRANGLPVVPNVGGKQYRGGIFWYRDGPTGVLLFSPIFDPAVGQLNSPRTLDCAKYKSVFRREAGYRRITNSDGTFTDEPGYEDLNVILSRIMAATTIVLNNFASPALIPWLTESRVTTAPGNPVLPSFITGIII